MIATVTSKGQVTLPKKVREALGIDAGTKLDFRLTDDARIEVRKVDDDPGSIIGLLKHLRRRPVSVREMNEAIADEAAALHKRSRR